MDMQKARDWIDLVLKVMSIIAIIAAGAWAYYQFSMSGTNEINVQIAVTMDTLQYTNDNRLLLIHARPKNIGKVPVIPQHLTVIVRRFPSDLKSGSIDLEKLEQVYTTDVLKKYPDGYDMELGVEYDEVIALVVPKGIYSASVEMDFGDNTGVDHTTITKVE